MSARVASLLVAVALIAAPRVIDALQADKVHRIGVLATTAWAPFESFRQGLRDLGYVEGRNVALEYRFSEGRQERLPELAADLVRLKSDVIVTWSTPAARAAKAATATIPIVMAASADPIAAGLVASLARPGGNVTGLAAHSPELEGKRLELLKEALPRLSRVALLRRRGALTEFVDETTAAARRLGVPLQTIEIADFNEPELKAAFAAMAKAHVDGLVVAPDTVAVLRRAEIAALAARHRLPAIYLHTDHAHAGGLMAYGPNYHDLFRRAAGYVDRVLKGTKPADLPVERSTRFDLVVNLKTARTLGLTLPPSLLLRADQVIE
jgi:putative ABC transport system substrate-binding protein